MEQPPTWNWDDNVDDDFDLVKQEDENGCAIFVPQQNGVHINKVCDRIAVNETNLEENEYSIDIWFLISKFIAPEDVGAFAGICKATQYVTLSAEFWFHLYKKYCKANSSMPLRLQSEQMKFRYGLRSCVIRCLYHTYPLFMVKKSTHNFHDFATPKDLLKRKCLSMWYKKSKDQWIFFFKLKLVKRSLYATRQTESQKKNIFNILDDISANQETDCKILKVFCGSFSGAPPVMGMILNTLYSKVAANMRHNCLYLGFSQSMQNYPNVTNSDFSVILNNVVKMDVLNWWHPEYPHSGEILPDSVIQNSDNSASLFDT